jgi:hypothetical protein
MACSLTILKALENAGAIVIDKFPFGVAVIEADADLNSVDSGVTVTLDLMVQLEENEEDAAIILTDAPLYQGTNKDGEGGRSRLQIKPPPLSRDDGKCSMGICRPMLLFSD